MLFQWLISNYLILVNFSNLTKLFKIINFKSFNCINFSNLIENEIPQKQLKI